MLLSAVAGHAASRVLEQAKDVRVVTTLFDVAEVVEYMPEFAERYDLSLEKLRERLPNLPVEVYGEQTYRDRFAEARGYIGQRDADDVHLLALALTLSIPIWSNDHDFDDAPEEVEVYPTAVLLKILGL